MPSGTWSISQDYFFCPCQRPSRFFSGLFFQDYFLLILPETLLKIFSNLELIFLVRQRSCTNFPLIQKLFYWYAGGAAQISPHSELIFLVHRMRCSKFHLLLIPLSQKARGSRDFFFVLVTYFLVPPEALPIFLPDLGNLYLALPEALPKFCRT